MDLACDRQLKEIKDTKTECQCCLVKKLIVLRLLSTKIGLTIAVLCNSVHAKVCGRDCVVSGKSWFGIWQQLPKWRQSLFFKKWTKTNINRLIFQRGAHHQTLKLWRLLLSFALFYWCTWTWRCHSEVRLNPRRDWVNSDSTRWCDEPKSLWTLPVQRFSYLRLHQ